MKHFPRLHSQPLRSCGQLVAHWCACMLHCMALVGHVWHPTPPTLAIDPTRAPWGLGGGLRLVGGCPVATRAPGLIQSRDGLSWTMEQMDCFWCSARRLSKFDGGISFSGMFSPFTERDVTGFLEKDPKILIFLSKTCLFRTCDAS